MNIKAFPLAQLLRSTASLLSKLTIIISLFYLKGFCSVHLPDWSSAKCQKPKYLLDDHNHVESIMFFKWNLKYRNGEVGSEILVRVAC